MVIVILVDDSVTTREHLPGASALRWASSAQFADGETEVRRGAGPSPKSHTQKLELGFLSGLTHRHPAFAEGPVLELSPRETAVGSEHCS